MMDVMQPFHEVRRVVGCGQILIWGSTEQQVTGQMCLCATPCWRAPSLWSRGCCETLSVSV
jgi:hypothetical protein